ncbi:hypothetical protein SK128_024513, partial [Halocaridina rubra]
VYEAEIVMLQSRHKEVLSELANREKVFQETELLNRKFRKTIVEMEKKTADTCKEATENVCNGNCAASIEAKQQLEKLIQTKREKEEDLNLQLEAMKGEKSDIKLKLEKSLLSMEKLNTSLSHIMDEKEQVEKQMNNLQRDLKSVKQDLTVIESQAKAVKEQENAEMKDHIKSMEAHLTDEKRECKLLRNELKKLTGQLNESRASIELLDTSSSQKEEEFLSRIRDLDEELKITMAEKVSLQNLLSVTKAREGEHQTKISELELLLTKLNETVQNLESKKSPSEAIEDMFSTKLKLLETQLSAAQAAHSTDKEKLMKLSDELQQAKRDLSDAKLDLRVAEREARSLQDTVAFLREKSKEQRSQLAEKDMEMKRVNDVADDLHADIERLESSIKKQEENKEQMNESHKQVVANLEQKITKLEDANKAFADLQKKLSNTQHLCDTLKLEKRGLETQIKMAESNSEDVKKEKSSLREELLELQKKMQQSDTVISQLKELCSTQDEELTEMMSLHDKMKDYEEEVTKLQQEIHSLKAEVKSTKASVNEEKSLKIFQEKKVQELEARLGLVDKENDEQVELLNEQLMEYTSGKAELLQHITSLEKELDDATTQQRKVERDLSLLHGQYERIQEEGEGHIQLIHNLKDSNFKLTEGLEEAISKAEAYKKKIEEIERSKCDLQAVHEDERVKMRSTIDQQTKLIDFLQGKTDNPKKKKNLKSKLFGKENKENTGYVMPHQYNELEDLLTQERLNNKILQEQIHKARAEIVSLKSSGGIDGKSIFTTPKMARTPLISRSNIVSRTLLPPSTPQNKRVIQNLTSSPSIQESASKQRMRHNIPHRWQPALQMRAVRCSGCLDSIPFARNAAKCQECNIVAHTKCSAAIPSTCGLPVQFAEHYSKGWTSESPRVSDTTRTEQQQPIQGWVKIPKPGKACWESCFIRGEKEEILIYDQEPVSGLQPKSRFRLSCPNAVTTVVSAVPKSELPDTSNVDLPYVLKVAVSARKVNGHSNSLYIMTTNFEEKQSWVMALESIVAELPNNEGDGEFQKEQIQLKVLMTSTNPVSLDVNTIAFINERTVVVGAAEGLYSFDVQKDGAFKSRARIEGLTSVHQVLVLNDKGLVLFIAGKDNLVYKVDKRILAVTAEASQMAKPNLTPDQIEPLQGCHLLAAGSTKAGQAFICAASSDRISILLLNESQDKFSVCRQYSTQEPCSCLHFTQASLIVGAEKFYEIDLMTFEIEEFLDESDPTLAYAIFGSAQMSSFPVAILQVSKPGKYEEYLLCFYEFAVFVDACGQRSREHDIKFTRLPIAIVFRRPYLYIVHQNAVEVIEIRSDCFTKVTSDADSDSDCSPPVRMVTKTMPKPSFIGEGPDAESIIVASRSHDSLEVVQVSACFLEDGDVSVSSWGTMPNFSVSGLVS